MKLVFSIFSLFLFLTAQAQPQFTDSSFGTNGQIIKNTSIPYKYIVGMALQTDGKTVLLAEAEYNTTTRMVLIRYNTNGTPDNTFNSDGIADTLPVVGKDFSPNAIKLQPDGKILVCGRSGVSPNPAFVARYTTTGSLDTTFGSRGVFYEPRVTINGSSFRVSRISNLTVLSGGKLMLLSSTFSTDADLILTRLNANGTIDSTWGTNGIVATDASTSYDLQYSKIEVQSDGKFLVGGNLNEYSDSLGVVLDIGVVRLKTNGSLDSTFGTNGRSVMHTGTAQFSPLKDMVLQSDGKVVVSGLGKDYNDNYRYAYAIRLTTAGKADISFGTGGTTILYPTGSQPFYSLEGQISLQTDGKLLLPGCRSTATGNYSIALTRLTTAGLPDASFDGDGYATLTPNAYDSYAFGARQQTDGKLVLGSIARNGNGTSVTIARFTATGGPDATLDATAAVAFIGSGTNAELGASLQLQPDGKIISINGRYNGAGYGGYDIAISRYTTTGGADASWGSGGTSLFETPSGFSDLFSTLLPNGKLLLATGYGDYLGGNGIFIIRLQPNGMADSSFGNNGRLFIKTRITSFINVVPQIAFQPDGKMVLCYRQQFAANGPDSTFIARLNADGSPDNTFNGTGKKFMSDSAYNYFNRLSLQPDGKIVATEQREISDPNGSNRITLVHRLTANGSVDNTFNNGQATILPFESNSITSQADGKIVVVGTYRIAACLRSNGLPDSSFGTAGISDLHNVSPYFQAVAVKETDSSRLILAGIGYALGTPYNLLQLIALRKNGTVDSSFGMNGLISRPELSNLQNETGLAVQPDGKLLLNGYLQIGAYGYSDAVLSRLKAVSGRTYRFTGSGLWSNPANWADGTVPPTTIPAGSSIVIDPPAGSECVIDIVVHVQTGASVTVKAGKRVRLPGNLIIQ